MPQVLRLTVMTGPHRGRKFCLAGTSECMMGRAPECFAQFAGTERDQYISRHHCRLSLDANALTVEDLESRCGTYLDGERIQSATLSLPVCSGCHAEECAAGDFQAEPLLTIGGTTVRLSVVDCPPRDVPELERSILWKDGETVKKDCPIPCA